MLPPGPSIVARVAVKGRFPDKPGAEAPVSLEFVDGCSGDRGGFNDNYVTWVAESRKPRLEPCAFVLRAHDERNFQRGDSNDDGQVRLADAITILQCRFLNRPARFGKVPEF